MAMRPWDPPSWAELDDGEEEKEVMDYFLDDVARVAGVASKDELHATFAHFRVIGGLCSVMQLFVINPDQVFQDLAGVVFYDEVGNRRYSIKK